MCPKQSNFVGGKGLSMINDTENISNVHLHPDQSKEKEIAVEEESDIILGISLDMRMHFSTNHRPVELFSARNKGPFRVQSGEELPAARRTHLSALFCGMIEEVLTNIDQGGYGPVSLTHLKMDVE